MLAYNLIGSGLVALGALSIGSMRARANWGSSALDRTIGAQEAASERAPSRDSDGGDHQHRNPSVVELGGSMGPRLIIVSNRVAVPEPGSKQMAGGLVVAVKAALRNRTGVWFGWSGKIDETETAEPRTVERNHMTYATIDLSKNDFEEYYILRNITMGWRTGSCGPSCTIASICKTIRAPTIQAICASIASSPTSSAPSSEKTMSSGCTTTT